MPVTAGPGLVPGLWSGPRSADHGSSPPLVLQPPGDQRGPSSGSSQTNATGNDHSCRQGPAGGDQLTAHRFRSPAPPPKELVEIAELGVDAGVVEGLSGDSEQQTTKGNQHRTSTIATEFGSTSDTTADPPQKDPLSPTSTRSLPTPTRRKSRRSIKPILDPGPDHIPDRDVCLTCPPQQETTLPLHRSPDTSNGDSHSSHFRSETTPEAQLLSKFRHVYAGKGGWLGVPAHRHPAGVSGRGGTLAHKGLSLVKPRGSWLPPSDGVVGVDGFTGGGGSVRKQRAMPKAQYERYKKEIMHKLARTLQHYDETAEVLRETGVGSKKRDREVHKQCLQTKEKAPVPSSISPANITMPANWRLPVGWAGRNSTHFLATNRQRPRQGCIRKQTENRHHKQHITADTTGGGSTRKSESLQSDANNMVLTHLSADRPLPDHSHFTSSWATNSAFIEGLHTQNECGDERGGEDEIQGLPHPYTLRIAPLLRGVPAEPDTDWPLAPISQIQTERVNPRPTLTIHQGALDSQRTSFTYQSLPLQATAGRHHDSEMVQHRKRKNSHTWGNRSQGMPTSTRSSMKMFSRMSLEAQAALKMCMVPPEDGTGEDESLPKGEEELKYASTDVPVPGSISVNGVTTAADVSKDTALRQNSRPNLQDYPENEVDATTAVNHVKPPSSSMPSDQESTGMDKMATEIKILPEPAKPVRKSTTGQIQSEERPIMMVSPNKEMVAFRHEPEVPSMVKSGINDEGSKKQLSCRVRAGLVLKNPGNSCKHASITLRVSSSQDITNGSDSHLKKSNSHETMEVLPDTGDAMVKVSLSQASKARTKLPDIWENPTRSDILGDQTVKTESTTPFLGTHRQIPGIGQYQIPVGVRSKPLVIRNWDREKTFEITPVGYDSRFKDIATRDEQDETPVEIKKKAILKCTDWLRKYHPTR